VSGGRGRWGEVIQLPSRRPAVRLVNRSYSTAEQHQHKTSTSGYSNLAMVASNVAPSGE